MVCDLWMPDQPATDLSTAQLARRTGVPAGTLRMWEARHGFPQPVRSAGGHRRYAERDAERVREVLRLRSRGLSLSAAIRSAGEAERPAATLFAGLRRLRPELQPYLFNKRALLHLTWAMEDEYCARATQGFLVASFQRERFYRATERRFGELARTAELAVALADFDVMRQPRGAAVEVPFDPNQPLAREWMLVVDAPGTRACLAGWERPSSSEVPDPERRFEVLWSFEPAVVTDAVRIVTEQIRALAPALAGRLPGPPDPAAGADPSELSFAAGLAHRMVAYLAGASPTA